MSDWDDPICDHCWWDLHRLYGRFTRRGSVTRG